MNTRLSPSDSPEKMVESGHPSLAPPLKNSQRDSHSSGNSQDHCHSLEDRTKGVCPLVDGLRHWLYEVEQLGIPKFGETGYKLRQFRDSLVQHWRIRETDLLENSQWRQESESLLAKLDGWIRQLEMTEPPFSSWQCVVRMLGEFSDQLESFETRWHTVTCTSDRVGL